jgi:hypothetical protein
MSNTFEVVFSGEVIDGYDAAETRAKIGKLFNADEAKIARLFSGSSIVIKKNLDEATANKYLGAFKNAGAVAIVRDAAEVEEIIAAPPPDSDTETAAPASSNTANSAASIFEHSGEASAHLKAAPKPQVELDSNPDLSELSLRESTGNLVEPPEETPEPVIDTSEFTLAATGTDLAEKKDEPAPLEADLSGITLVDN